MFKPEFLNGVLFIDGERKVRVYKVASKADYKVLVVSENCWRVTDARWQGSNVVMTLISTDGKNKQSVRVYEDFGRFKVMHL